MHQRVARSGRIGIVSSVLTDRLKFARPVETWVSDAAGFDAHSRTDEHGRTYAWWLAGRWLGVAQVGAQRLPDIGGQRQPVVAGRLAAQDDPPGAPVEVVRLQPRRLDRRKPKRATHEGRVVADGGGMMSQLSSSRCTSLAVIAFETPVL